MKSAQAKKKIQIEAQQKTIAVTAIWHGLYPGYFFAFFHWTLILQISQELFRIEKESGTLKKWRNKLKYLEIVVINYFIDYVGVFFVVLTWEKIVVFLTVTYGVPLIVVYVANVMIIRLAIFSKRAAKKGEHTADKRTDEKTA
jgi:hypothetical protein